MAFAKYAYANIIKPDINIPIWDRVRDSAQALGSAFSTREASRISLAEYHPKDYLLSHATIVASVDTEKGPGALGRHLEEGFTVDRAYSDYYVTPRTSKYINNNADSWERKLLLATFRTFIGGENYLEHLQIPEMSKGKIVDAAARDIGDSIYIDILVATHRRHRPLIAAINSRQLQTMSMGCFVAGTPVTLADGRRVPIEEVQPGDFVITHKGRPREVLNKQMRFGTWRMRETTVVGVPSPIRSTANHPFFAVKPASTCACGCGLPLKTDDRDPIRRLTTRYRNGHRLRLLNHNGAYSLEEARERRARVAEIESLQLAEVRSDALAVGDLLCVPRVRGDEIGEGVSVERGRLLGYFLAEGSFLKYKGAVTETQFNFCLDERDTLVRETVDLLQKEWPQSRPWVQVRPKRNTATVHVCGRDIARWFLYHGGEYAGRKRLSYEAMYWSEETHRALLQAWLRGDGGPSVSMGWVGLTTSYDLACQLELLFARCGVHCRVECRLDGKCVPIERAVNAGYSVRGETGGLAGFSLAIPDAQLSALGLERRGEHTQHLRVTDDNVLRPVTGVTDFNYEGWVFDLEVDEDHSYLVHGIAVHNCNVAFTLCTKCGNRATDDTQLCAHVKYEKGNKFLDILGTERRVAELCGHVSEPGSNRFIEASWVGNPAFLGAVLRAVLTPEEAAVYDRLHSPCTQVAFSTPARTSDPSLFSKAARRAFDFGEEKEQFPGGGADDAAKKEEKKDPLESLVDDLTKTIKDRAVQKLRRDMDGDAGAGNQVEEDHANHNLVPASTTAARRKMAGVVRSLTSDRQRQRTLMLGALLQQRGGWKAVAASKRFSGRDVLAISRLLDQLHGSPSVAGAARIYRTVLAVGGTSPYVDVDTYLAACSRVLGREPTQTEKLALITKGRLFDLGN